MKYGLCFRNKHIIQKYNINMIDFLPPTPPPSETSPFRDLPHESMTLFTPVSQFIGDIISFIFCIRHDVSTSKGHDLVSNTATVRDAATTYMCMHTVCLYTLYTLV